SMIIRDPALTPKLGNGIFLQGIGYPSYLKVACSNTYASWWTGIASIEGTMDIYNTKSQYNNVGGAYLYESQVQMFNSCFDDNDTVGVDIRNSNVVFGNPGASIRGYNRVVQNAVAQVRMADYANFTTGFNVNQQQY